jgi:Surface antigen variable number repeat
MRHNPHPGEFLEIRRTPAKDRVKILEQRVASLQRCLGPSPNEAARPLGKVGRILVVGNTETREPAILGCLPFKPGDTFSDADLAVAIRRLELLKIFTVDPRPQVTVIDPDAPWGEPTRIFWFGFKRSSS